MKLSAQDLSSLLKGRLSGDGARCVTGVSGLEEATSTDLSFLKETKPEKMVAFHQSQAGIVLVPPGIDAGGKTVIEVANPLSAFAVVLNTIEREKRPRTSGVHATAVVHPSAKIGSDVRIGPLCVVEENAEISSGSVLMAQVYVGARSKIGSGSLLYPQVVIREDVDIGERCILHSGCVVGSDGFGFFYAEGRHNKIPQIGKVVIENDVELGACVAIDRAMIGKTIIKTGTKLDNLVHIAHNVEVGEHSLLAAQSGVAGSSKLGRGVVLAGQVGVADHIQVADGTQVGAQSGVKENTQPGDILFGSPAQALQNTLKQILLIRRLPELFKDVKILKEKTK